MKNCSLSSDTYYLLLVTFYLLPDMKTDIVFTMLMRLLDKKKTTAQELARELEISVRTVYRYVNALTLANVPVQTSAGREGGIWIDEDYKLAANFFSAREKGIISDSLNANKNSDNEEEIETIIRKLYSV